MPLTKQKQTEIRHIPGATVVVEFIAASTWLEVAAAHWTCKIVVMGSLRIQ